MFRWDIVLSSRQWQIVAICKHRCDEWVSFVELSFHLAMKSGQKMGAVVSERDATRARELERERSETTRLRAALCARDDEIRALKQQLKSVEERSLEEVKEKSTRIHGLSSELDARAETIAHLTMQLHHVKQRTKRKQLSKHIATNQTPGDGGTTLTTSSTHSLARSVSSPTPVSMCDMPRPPSTPRQKSQNISRASTPKEQSISPQKRLLPAPPDTNLVVISEKVTNPPCPSPRDTRAPRAIRYSRLSQPQIPPDAAEFLHTTRIQPTQFTAKEPPTVLPPIGSVDEKPRRKVHIKRVNGDREEVGSDASQIIKDPSVGSSATWQKLTSKHPGSTD